jgi:radical SAM superfamily enzyme YgiQ (UPF0313 family)
VPIVLGGIEGRLRRIAHYDYWSDKVRRSIVVDAKCDLLLYGNAERALSRLPTAWRQRAGQQITDVRGTAFAARMTPRAKPRQRQGWFEIDSTSVDEPGRVDSHVNPYQTTSEQAAGQGSSCAKAQRSRMPNCYQRSYCTGLWPRPICNSCAFNPAHHLSCPTRQPQAKRKVPPRERSVIRLPSYEQVKSDPVLYAHASRVLHLETNPGNARAGAGPRRGRDRARRVDQPAAHPADHGRDGPRV